MLDEVRQQVDATVVPLLKGILDDTQTLLRQEIALAKVEVREDAKRARDAAISFGAAILAGLLASVLLAFTAVHALVAIIPSLPLWAAYGIVTLLIGAVAAVLMSSALSKAKTVKGVPEKTVETMRENVQWIQRKV